MFSRPEKIVLMVLGLEDRVLKIFNFDVSPETAPGIFIRRSQTLTSEIQLVIVLYQYWNIVKEGYLFFRLSVSKALTKSKNTVGLFFLSLD